MGKVLAVLCLVLAVVFVLESFAQVATTPPPLDCALSGGVCIRANKCNFSVVLPGSFNCNKKKVCCQTKQCPGTCLFKPNCKPIIARVPNGPYNCAKREVCCEDIEVPKCPGSCVKSKKCKKQGGTIQPRPHDCPPKTVCCV